MGKLPVAMLSFALALLALAASASAGTYTVNSCSPLTSPGPWGEIDEDPAGMSAGNLCGGSGAGPLGGGIQGALYAQDNTQSVADEVPGSAQAGWEFTAPAGLAVAGVRFYRFVDVAPTSDDWVAGMFTAEGAPLETCQGTASNGYACSLPNNQVPVSIGDLDASGLFFGVRCELQGVEEYCLTGSGSDHLVTAAMYSVAVTLSEAGAPTLWGESGPLWEGGIVSGTVPLRFDASDPSGIASVSLSDALGGVASVSEPCSYSQAVPCPQQQPGAINFDTASMPDGPTQLTLSVFNAAGNDTSSSSPTLVIDNDGPPPPSGLSASALVGAKEIALSWSNPRSAPAPLVAAHAELCQATCSAPASLRPSGSGQIAAPGAGSYTLKLWLTDTDGKGGPQNAATTTLRIPENSSTERPGGKAMGRSRKLRLRARRSGRRLRVSVIAPASERGSVTVRLARRRGKRLHVLARHKARPRHSRARTVFVLATQDRHARVLVVIASAHGAMPSRLRVVLRKRS